MPLRAVAGGGNIGTLQTTVNLIATYQAYAAPGDLVIASTSSNMAVNSQANNQSPNALPWGKVVSVERGSKVATVEWYNVSKFVTHKYSTVMTRGSNVIGANDDSTVTGSATFTAGGDLTYVMAVDAGNTTCTFAVMG